MIKIYLTGFLCILFFTAHSQLNLGGFHANFGVDADTRAGYTKFGPAATSPAGDDWFNPFSTSGKGVVDVTNADYYKTRLQANTNMSFIRNMSAPLFSQVSNHLWLDAIYIRDYTSANGKDSTVFGNAAKNGENPMLGWNGSVSSIPGKTDIVDGYAHFRRNGNSVNDSLWLFTGASTVGTNGDRYFDIELYKNHISYNRTTKMFTSLGLANGHTEWLFDLSGNLIQSGDLIISVCYKSGKAPEIDVRIWVNKLTYNLIDPALFRFGNKFDGGLLYGYASILAADGSTNFGSGIGNFFNNQGNQDNSTDSTYATPWGSMNTDGDWSQTYDKLQFVEMGLNFTRMGLDPAMYNNLNPCTRIFHSIFFKSRSSNSFSANLQDFAGPVEFEIPGLGALDANTDTLDCRNPLGTLSVANTNGVGIYNWSTTNGNIVATSPDNSQITVAKSGTYKFEGRLAEGCPVSRTEYLYVPVDSIMPGAEADITMTPSGELQLLGNCPLLYNLQNLLFGPSQGVSYNWTGPNNFTADIQNPMINLEWAWGAYYLTVTENRNGCSSMTSLDVSFGLDDYDQIDGYPTNMNNATPETTGKTYLRNTNAKLYMVTDQPARATGAIAVYNAAGQLLASRNVNLNAGQNTIEIPVTSAGQVRIVSLYVGKQLSFIRKVLF